MSSDWSAPLSEAAAPGKLILLGEHAVVYGRSAIAVPVRAVGAHASVFVADHPVTIRSVAGDGPAAPVWRIDVATAPDGDPLATAVRATLAHVGERTLPRWHIEVSSTVPLSRGMGSSAAVAVAVARATARAVGCDLPAADVSEIAFHAERRAHGTPSGIDNTVIAWDRAIRFTRGAGDPLAVGGDVHLVIADSGRRAPTREIVAALRSRRDADPDAHERWFDEIDRLVDEAIGALAECDVDRLGRLMTDNHALLVRLGVSTGLLDDIVRAALSAGARGAKMSGAGGGGVAVALVDQGGSGSVAAAMRAAGAAHTIETAVR